MDDETLNIDTPEDVNDVDEGGEDTTDYKALVEQERAAREQAEAEANKWKDRFKKTKARDNNLIWVNDYVNSLWEIEW